jgi:hypothetical protein
MFWFVYDGKNDLNVVGFCTGGNYGQKVIAKQQCNFSFLVLAGFTVCIEKFEGT